MRLSDEEQAMLAGDHGPARRWAIDHQVKVGRMFDAADMVPVAQAHMMGDPEALGEAGAAFLEDLADQGARARIPTITDPRGV
ncbi:MAG: aconitase X, partial [Pseudomonadota bacterium]